MTANAGNIDPFEIEKFNALSELWWDRQGRFKALHDINPVRLSYIRERAVVGARTVLDVGCGGGLLSESLARAGAQVTGIDMSLDALKVAGAHALASRLTIDYRHLSAEQLAGETQGSYDVVTCMELVEHVPDAASLVASCSRLVKAGGDVFFATVNRTWLSRLLVIWASEYLLGIVKRGTHRFERFIQPNELLELGRCSGLRLVDVSGLRYIPFVGISAMSTDLRMNYMMHFQKPLLAGNYSG